MERVGVPSPLEDDDDAPSKVANKNGLNTHRGSLPITPIDSALLSPYYPHIQIPTVNPHTPPATVGTPSAYQQSDFDSEGDAHESPSVNYEDVGTSPRPGSAGKLVPPKRKLSWGRPEKQSKPNLNTDIVGIGMDSAGSDPSQTRSRSISASSINSLTSWTSSVVNTPSEKLKEKEVYIDPFFGVVDRLERTRSPAPYVPPSPNRHLTIDTGVDCSSQNTTASPLLPFPQITVSDWGRGENPTISNALVLNPPNIETDLGVFSQQNNTPNQNGNGPLDKEPQLEGPQRGNGGGSVWSANHHGSGAGIRSIGEILSLNDLALSRQAQERNKAIEEWLSVVEHSHNNSSDVGHRTTSFEWNNVTSEDIPLGHHTKNHLVPGQLYYSLEGQHHTEQDLAFMRAPRNWVDPPTIPTISQPGTKPLQPPSSRAAMELFQRMCQETGSTTSGEASCGTRRWNFQSSEDSHTLEKGNFLFQKVTTTTRPPISMRPSSTDELSTTNPRKRSGIGVDGASVKTEVMNPSIKKLRSWDEESAVSPDTIKPESIEEIERTGLNNCDLLPCNSCNRRVVHCDQVVQLCTNCAAWVANHPVKKKEVPHSYTSFLVTRVQYLETLLRHNNIKFLENADYRQLPKDDKSHRLDPTALREYREIEEGLDYGSDPKGASPTLDDDIEPMSDATELAYKSLHASERNNNTLDLTLDTSTSGVVKSPQLVDVGTQADIQDNYSTRNAPASPTCVEQADEHQNTIKTTERHEADTKTDMRLVAHQSQHQFRQVGLVRVQVEVLSLSEKYQMQEASEDQFESDPEESDQAQEDPPTDGIDSTNQGGTDVSSLDHSGSTHMNLNGRNRKRGEEDKEEEEDGNKRACRRPSGPPQKMNLPRLACPYQAYEKFQSCLRPGRSNQEGGCAGISRLKQHLNRRHVLSFRCQRCWKSFDKKSNVQKHEMQRPPCDPRDKPWDERFIAPEQEAEIEQACRHKAGEDAWWSLFRLVIPGMQSRNVQSLVNEYSPYYIRYHTSLMVPAMTFPALSYQPIQPSQSVLGSLTFNNGELNDAFLPPSGAGTPSLPFALPALAPPAHGFSMPLLEFSSTPGEDLSPNLFCSSSSSNDVTRLSSLDNATSPPMSSSNIAPTPLTSAPTPTVLPPHGRPAGSGSSSNNSSSEASGSQAHMQVQMHRNYERLKTRNQQVQRENAEFREANRENRADLDRVDAIVEEMLALDELDVSVFERLSQVSEILSCVRGRMR